jgi:hypothetical protein
MNGEMTARELVLQYHRSWSVSKCRLVIFGYPPHCLVLSGKYWHLGTATGRHPYIVCGGEAKKVSVFANGHEAKNGSAP